MPFEIRDIGTSSATADANGTAKAFQLMDLQNVFHYDNNGNLLDGHLAIHAQPGFIYPGPTPVPEPSTVVLTVTGALALIGLKLRRQRQDRAD